MSAKIAINAFDRTGGMFFWAALHDPDLESVAVDELAETASN